MELSSCQHVRQGAKAVKWRSQIVIVRPHCQLDSFEIGQSAILSLEIQGDQFLVQKGIEMENV